jgi:hypothetical protein
MEELTKQVKQVQADLETAGFSVLTGFVPPTLTTPVVNATRRRIQDPRASRMDWGTDHSNPW